ncbi:hypothetical protein SCHPADRAFT_419928 [Schizopora paradoxa]|uniref:NACHT domain-containing protein n=1 Tax=Schizopora paradoxa TaxID=27342 RepID=A0A0H2RLJ4_9AGAM|nr:hypothetical protein SCHPADRAFT_419928 [Schizopora paradoxa]
MSPTETAGRSFKSKLLDLIICKRSSVATALDSEREAYALKPRELDVADHSGVLEVATPAKSDTEASDKSDLRLGNALEVHPSKSNQLQRQPDGNFREHEAADKSDPTRLAPNDEKDDSTSKGPYSHLIQTTDSLVTAVLEGLKDVGSNLPGIGAIAVVLSLKDKLQLEDANRKEVEDILKYIEVLCRSANGARGIPDMSHTRPIQLSDDLIRHLKRASKDLEATKGRNRVVRLINANAIEEELKAIWEGIQRHMNEFQFAATIKSDRVLSEVYKKLWSEAEKEEERRINDVLERMPAANLARHDAQRTERSRVVACSKGTRVNVIKDIQDWAMNADDDGKHVFWLNGLAGTGKSTIAKSVAEWALKEKILGANFFFARDIAELNGPSLVFSTLSYELSRFDAEFKRALYEVLYEDSRVPFSNLETQFEKLICRPFAACRGKRPILVMLDALDECAEDAGILLRLFLKYKAESAEVPNLRIFITSRPETRIRSVLYQPTSEKHFDKFILHDIDARTVREDIQTYLDLEFSKITSGTLGSHIPPDWPAQDDRTALLDLCGKFFAYAATAIRFIGDEVIGDPVEQLRDVLRITSTVRDDEPSENDARPYVELDSLYLEILNQSVSKTAAGRYLKRTRRVLATVLCLREPLSVSDIAQLLSISVEDVSNALRNLHSIIAIPDNKRGLLQFFHASFPDFIRDQERCTDSRFYVDTASSEILSLEHVLSLRCMAIVGKVDFSVTLPSLVAYASKHWPSHLKGGFSHEPCSESSDGLSYIPPTQLNTTPRLPLGILRETEVREIREWATRTDDSAPPIFWLTGEMGTDISALLFDILDWARQERNFLLGYYGFRPRVEGGSDVTSVLPTLASQLADTDTGYKKTLIKVLCENKDIASNSNFEEQFKGLFLSPLSTRQSEGPIIIILEGISLYTSEKGGMDMLKNVMRMVELGGGLFRVLIEGSREAEYIPQFMSELKTQRKCEAISLMDIRTRNQNLLTLQSMFKKIIKDADKYVCRIPERWPWGESAFKILVYNSGFWCLAYNDTARRFIRDKNIRNPVSQLQEIQRADEIQLELEDGHLHIKRMLKRYEALHKLFTHILRIAAIECSSVFENSAAQNLVQRVVATVACCRNTPRFRKIELGAFLSGDGDPNPVLLVPQSLQSVIFSGPSDLDDPEDYSIAFHDTEFRDFIRDESYCVDKRFLVNIPEHENFMALRCLEILRNDTVVPETVMQYALRSWLSHLKSGTCLCDELVQHLIWLCSGEARFRRAYSYALHHNGREDPIFTLQSLVGRYNPRDSDALLAALLNRG